MYITWFHTSMPSWNLRPKKLRSPCKKSVVGTWHAWSGSKRWSLLPLLDLTCPKLRKRSSYLEKCDIAIKKQKSMHDGDFNQIYVVQKHYSQLAKRSGWCQVCFASWGQWHHGNARNNSATGWSGFYLDLCKRIGKIQQPGALII